MNIKTLNNLGFVEANKIVIDLVNTLHIISDNELEDILELKERELIATFLENYNNFSENQFFLLERYINKNLEIKDKDFVSDLIDFSSDWSLNINYKKLLSFMYNHDEENHYVVLSTVNYITENIKLFYIKEIVKGLENILNNPKFYQNVQISAALCLFRITHNKKYILEIKEWFDGVDNILFLKNKTKLNYYKNRYFCYNLEKTLIGKHP